MDYGLFTNDLRLERVELRGVLIEVRGDEGVEDLLDRHLAAGRMDSATPPRLRRERSGGIGDLRQRVADPREERLGIGVAVALDRGDAGRRRSSRVRMGRARSVGSAMTRCAWASQ